MAAKRTIAFVFVLTALISAVVAILMFSSERFRTEEPRELGFYYGDKTVPESCLNAKRIALLPSSVTFSDLLEIKRQGVVPLAYISILEADPDAYYFNDMPSEILTNVNNENWNSIIIDIRKESAQQFILGLVESALDKGFSGVFIDTMDSYELVSKREWPSYQSALVKLVKRIRNILPANSQIWTNRGFNELDQIASVIDGVAFESLYRDFDGSKYFMMPDDERDWLMEKAREAKKKGLKVVSIEYFPKPPSKQELRKVERLKKQAGIDDVWLGDGVLETCY